MPAVTPPAPSDTPSAAARDLCDQVRVAFGELPAMRLTRRQFRRLWNLSDAQCDVVLSCLAADGFLVVGRDGRIGRRQERGD